MSRTQSAELQEGGDEEQQGRRRSNSGTLARIIKRYEIAPMSHVSACWLTGLGVRHSRNLARTVSWDACKLSSSRRGITAADVFFELASSECTCWASSNVFVSYIRSLTGCAVA